MMANMTPEQMEQMRRMAGSMGMAMPPGAAEAMRNMTADDMRQAAQEMGNMTPDQLKSQYEQAQGQAKASAAYKYSASEALKTEGNKLVGEGKYEEAIEKYARVKSNLSEDTSRDARTLRLSCLLNSALCFNKIGKHDSAVGECAEALTIDPRSLKAYYRRGQAYVAKGDLERGVGDLMRANKLSPGDETVKAELDACVKTMESRGLAVPVTCPAFDHPDAPAAASSSGSQVPGMPGLDSITPEMQAQVESMMNDPNAMEQMSSMLGNLSEEQLAQMAASNPMMAGMDSEAVKKAASMMKNMKPDTMKAMMKMAKSFGADGAQGVDPAGGDMMAKVQKELNNPEMRQAMVDMMQSMDVDTIKEMSKSMGMSMDDAQAEQAANALKNISPQTMNRMLTMASYAGSAYTRFKRPIDWAIRNKRTAMSIFVVFTAVSTTYLLRWWRRRGGDVDEVNATEPLLGGDTTF